jgi:hypothetical protein
MTVQVAAEFAVDGKPTLIAPLNEEVEPSTSL